MTASRMVCVLVAAVLLTLLPGARAAVPEPTSAPVRPVPRCEVAVVNPVSGHAECVQPRGASVEEPPPRPNPTPEECARQPDLDVPACRGKQPEPGH